MTIRRSLGWGVGGLAAVLGIAGASYAAYAALTWCGYGHPPPPAPDESDALLDRFMPEYDVVERHHLQVNAPATVTFEASMDVDLEDSTIVRAIFLARELVLGAEDSVRPPGRGLIATTKAIGWRVLAEVPGREIVMGAVTQPWKPSPVFRGIDSEEFAAFAEPDHVKIVWTLRADPIGADRSVARTETRVVATDAHARSAFRRYWSLVSPGVALIREVSLRLVKKGAERRAEVGRATVGAAAFQRDSGSSTDTRVPPVSGTSI